MKVRPIHFVPDVDEAIRFYEALGLRADARARPGHWVELVGRRAASSGLHDAAVAADGEGRTGVQLNFIAEEPLEVVERRLRDAGFPPEGTIVDQEWGRSLFVPGPAGSSSRSTSPTASSTPDRGDPKWQPSASATSSTTSTPRSTSTATGSGSRR